MSEPIRADHMSFEHQYGDDSGVQYAVRLRTRHSTGETLVQLEHCGTVDFPITELDWLIACLQRIKDEVKP
jgi:hypothetical protein